MFDSLVWKKKNKAIRVYLKGETHSNHGNDFNGKKKNTNSRSEDDKIKVSWKLSMKSMSRIRDD